MPPTTDKDIDNDRSFNWLVIHVMAYWCPLSLQATKSSSSLSGPENNLLSLTLPDTSAPSSYLYDLFDLCDLLIQVVSRWRPVISVAVSEIALCTYSDQLECLPEVSMVKADELRKCLHLAVRTTGSELIIIVSSLCFVPESWNCCKRQGNRNVWLGSGCLEIAKIDALVYRRAI